jgi:hypothetical protein
MYLRFLVMTAAGLVACGPSPAMHPDPQGGSGAATVRSSVSPAQGSTVELEKLLYIQDPHFHLMNGQAGIHVLWIPQPIQKLCLWKTAEQCSTIDYCIRTTNRDVSKCKNLGVDITRLPAYPHDMMPRRMLSVIYFQQASIKGFASLQKFYDSAPKATLNRLSASARIKARIRLTRSADDDNFDLLEVLAVPPF